MYKHLDALVAACSLIGIIYKVAKLEEKINDRIQSIEARLDIHLREYQIRREWIDYLINALDQKIDHKFNRLFEEIKKIQKE
jgi:hypothetical protein